jgi:hypothetical protein
MSYIVDPELSEYANESQKTYIEAVNRLGSFHKAEQEMKMGRDAIRASIRRLKERAALRGYAPEYNMDKTVPDGFFVTKVSTNYRDDGSVAQQWIQSKPDEQAKFKILIDAIENALAKERPRTPAIKKPLYTTSSLCNLYTFTDYHMGMLAWYKEAGADWNIEIATNVLIGCFEQMISMSPAAKVCVINQLGDFLHFDGLAPVTPTSGHIVDNAGNYSQVVEATIDVLCRVVDIALMKHEEVHLVLAEGNHDMGGSVWLRKLFKKLYRDEPRLTINDSETPYYIYAHGETLLGFSHGHKKKKEGLPLLFAAKFRKEWGAATKTYIHCGHYHHEDVKEYPGAKVIQHPTLAASDAYAARGGWLSERQASGITYHEKYGKVGEVVVTPEMLS